MTADFLLQSVKTIQVRVDNTEDQLGKTESFLS